MTSEEGTATCKAEASFVDDEEIVTSVGRAFQAAGFQLYEVGGSIRDALLGVHSHDYDFATNAKARPDPFGYGRDGIWNRVLDWG